MTMDPCRRRTGEALPRAEKFGDVISADHKVLNEGCESRDNHLYAVVIQDLATQWIQSFPCKTKTSHETEKSLRKFFEPSQKPKVIYTDNSLEFGKSCEDLSWNHCSFNTPSIRDEWHSWKRRKTSERRYFSSQSGLDERWWAESMEWYCHLRNVQDLVADGKTPYERRFGESFKGPIIPFGAMVEYRPIPPRDKARVHQLGKKVLPGIFFWLRVSRGRIWKGDILKAVLEDLEKLDASEIYPRRINAKAVLITKRRRIH